jgi:t-SNARE complex subunit (syntaxin)
VLSLWLLLSFSSINLKWKGRDEAETMSMMIETDLKDVLNQLGQRFDRLEQKLDKIESDLTDLKVDMATVKADLTTVKEEVKDLRGSQRAQIWALIGIIFTAVVSAVIKFGFFSNV